MNCPRCQNPIPEGSAFCPRCGYTMTPMQNPSQASWAEPPKKSNKGLLLGILAGAAVLVCIVLAVILVVVLKGQKKTANTDNTDSPGIVAKAPGAEATAEPEPDPAEQYAAAEALLDKGDYAGAQEAFIALGDYQDARDMAAYAAARSLLAQGKYAEARDAFRALKGFRDSAELLTQCENELTYAEAMAKKEAGDYEAAIQLFAKIPGVKDADSQAEECRIQLAVKQIDAAIAQQDWDTALELLDAPEGQHYPDHDNVRQSCFNHANYAKAKQAMEDKLYYTAYKLFSAMGNYQDAASLAATCQRPTPDTGEMSRNGDYKRQTCRLNLSNKLKGGYNIYVRVYDSTGKIFVSSVFLRSGKGAVIYLPEDTYLLKAAYGKGPWYGELEMFGDDAIYKKLFTAALTNAGWRGTWYFDFEDELAYTTIKREDF